MKFWAYNDIKSKEDYAFFVNIRRTILFIERNVRLFYIQTCFTYLEAIVYTIDYLNNIHQ